ncbi:unnamed protein product [Cochlearia groenlandica]
MLHKRERHPLLICADHLGDSSSKRRRNVPVAVYWDIEGCKLRDDYDFNFFLPAIRLMLPLDEDLTITAHPSYNW